MSTLRQLRSMLYALSSKGPWRWQLTGENRNLWELVHGGSTTAPSVYAIGQTLSPQARLIAELHPQVLAELGVSEENCQLALERLQRLQWSLERVQRRAYRQGQREHYQDLGEAMTELQMVLRLLESHVVLTTQDLQEWVGALPAPDRPPETL